MKHPPLISNEEFLRLHLAWESTFTTGREKIKNKNWLPWLPLRNTELTQDLLDLGARPGGGANQNWEIKSEVFWPWLEALEEKLKYKEAEKWLKVLKCL